MAFEWLARMPELTVRNLTIREQARLAENPLDLRWEAIAPRTPVDSIKLSEITTVDFRPVGGRREWNAQGREIPERIGPAREFEMVPINPTHHINERQLQLLKERANGMDELVRRGIMKDVNTWPTALADAGARQIERDWFEAWYLNVITVMDPKDGATVTVDIGIDAAKHITEGSTWVATAGSAWNAWTRLTFHAAAYRRVAGSLGAIRTRQAVIDMIVAAAPAGANGIATTEASLSQRFGEAGFQGVVFIADERTYDDFTDGGGDTVERFYVPDGHLAFQPANGRVGRTYFAPVTRADDYLNRADIDAGRTRDFVQMRREKNGGKTLMLECQANAISLPEEQFTYVVDTGL